MPNQFDDGLTIKVEPLDIDWDDDDMALSELKNKMGILPKKKRRKRSVKKASNKINTRSQKQTCALCSTVFRGRSALLKHYAEHKESKLKANMVELTKVEDEGFFHCYICMKEFTSEVLFKRHKHHHVDRPFYCELCNKNFKQPQNFLLHMNTHNDNTEFKCTTCNFSSRFKLAFDRHVQSHERQEYKCDLCNKVFAARTWFIEHKNFHTGEKPFSCEECGKCFPYSRYLHAHKKSMHPHVLMLEPVQHKCNICKKIYSHRNSLRMHMKTHTGENKYLCDICGKSLSSTDKLQLHKRIHSGYKPYSCTECGKCFTKKDILTDHIRVHSGEKPFACETCGKCFSQRSPLTIHKRYHTGERPYVCHLCNKGFVSKGILSIHLKQSKH